MSMTRLAQRIMNPVLPVLMAGSGVMGRVSTACGVAGARRMAPLSGAESADPTNDERRHDDCLVTRVAEVSMNLKVRPRPSGSCCSSRAWRVEVPSRARRVSGRSTPRRLGHILVTMNAQRSIAAGEFTAKCLELLVRVERDGDAIVVTERGRPVAKVVPVEPPASRPLRGSVRYLSDIVEAIG